jgi:hypothetical protein
MGVTIELPRTVHHDKGGVPIRPQVFALLLGRGDGCGGRWAARIVPILHAFLEESIARLALQSLVIRTELASRHFLVRIDCKTRPRWQERNQSGSQKRATKHDESPCLRSVL